MEQSLKKRILKYIRIMQPVKLSTLLSDLNIDRESYYAATLFLRQERKIIQAGRFGIFAGDEAYMEWRAKHGRQINNNVP
ncbi:hypothetical protein LGI69_004676 [Salmonella enterica]|uniref:DUF977 family protein n=2 Tax=Salmonella diarizonae TaxID=59204 RepID=A0A7U5YDF0_SALDZ|nr:hypothetical protein [Salmonella enterica]EAA2774505.1 hypothetical protein [Salmonella enterica subsp. diarizonae]ECO1512738.1 hypothetical protein [Salmonella enterica subsp. arizonae]EDW6118844.1 hypothetical protein [Salmonella enterica subsp. salamae]EEH8382124.1 hypothetical protein [Salmonella enterica subsp. enterica serovar Montevideo]EKN5802359.1 hypothetical protein [Salmonella enterica subsp. enterica]HCM1871920.1 hypothetical protein [Salmonella enterica subsp. diarizonae sero